MAFPSKSVVCVFFLSSGIARSDYQDIKAQSVFYRQRLDPRPKIIVILKSARYSRFRIVRH